MAARDGAEPADGGWLAVVAGEQEGARYPLAGEELTLGRGTDNDLVLPDIAVSRRHLRLVATRQGWHFRDLGSGNGTRVNGRAEDEGELLDGDQVEVGNSVLEYLATDRPPGRLRVKPGRPARRRRARGAAAARGPTAAAAALEGRPTQAASDFRAYRQAPSLLRVAVWSAAAALIVLALAVVTASWLALRDGAPSAARAAGLAHFRRGTAAASRGDWDGALRAYQDAARADPGLVDADRAARETERYRELYRRGLELAAKGRWEQAAGLFSEIPRAAAYHPEARAALAAAIQAASASSTGAAAPVASAAAARPPAPAPSPPPPSPSAPTSASPLPSPLPAPSATTRAAPPGGPVDPAVDEALRRYRSGDFDGAAHMLQGVADRGDARAAAMAAAVGRFREAHAAGAAALEAGRADEAIEKLDAALVLDEGLGRGYRPTVGRQLAEALARRAADLLAAGRLRDAARTAVRARSHDAAHKGAGAVLDRLVVRARELTIEAMDLRNRDPEAAKERAETAMRIVPRRSAEYQRAADLAARIEDSL